MNDRSRLFIELTAAALADVQREIIARGVPTKEISWGSRTLRIEDPDGNELYFPYSG